VALTACALSLAACSGSGAPASNSQAAIDASQAGDQKTAVSFAKKEVARFAKPEQCSPGMTINCGTLALAYSSLAEYQILDGDPAGGELSFAGAKAALEVMDVADKASATGMVYRDVSEAYWKTGDHPHAIAIFKEGRAAGGDSWLYTSAAAQAVAKADKAAHQDADRAAARQDGEHPLDPASEDQKPTERMPPDRMSDRAPADRALVNPAPVPAPIATR
jgi:hypothetical protein